MLHVCIFHQIKNKQCKTLLLKFNLRSAHSVFHMTLLNPLSARIFTDFGQVMLGLKP